MTSDENIDTEIGQFYSELNLIRQKKNDGTDNGHPPPSVLVISSDMLTFAFEESGMNPEDFSEDFSSSLIDALSIMFELGNRVAESGKLTSDLEPCDCFVVPEVELLAILSSEV